MFTALGHDDPPEGSHNRLDTPHEEMGCISSTYNNLGSEITARERRGFEDIFAIIFMLILNLIINKDSSTL